MAPSVAATIMVARSVAAVGENPLVRKITFTGSEAAGQIVYEAGAKRIVPVSLELGGKSPMIICADATLDKTVTGAIAGMRFTRQGQSCTAASRIYVHEDLFDAFMARITEALEGLVIGDPMDPDTSFGPMVSKRQMEIALGYVEKGKAEGARLVYGGAAIDRDGFYMQPTVFADVTDDMSIAREEIFGPVMSVLDFETEAEVMARANATEFGLAAGVFTKDLSRAHRVAAGFEAGTCYINTYNDAPVEAPFGGMKNSGVGRENSKAAIDHYSQLKTVYVRMGDMEAPF